ncbi:MAG: hypothetical protein M1277_00100 [Patescibacteria group bacterium]|nr:hypothetical protein [Patescibacteria group bacterium]
MQAIVRARGFVLPDRIRSSELYKDTEYTKIINDISNVQTGDIVGLCPLDKTDFWGIHVGIIWIDDTDTTYVVHNAKHTGALQRERIEDALKHERHNKIAWIKRPIVKNNKLSNPQGLDIIGLGYLAKHI